MDWKQILGCIVLGLSMTIAIICLKTDFFDKEYTTICVFLYTAMVVCSTSLITGVEL